MTIYLKQSTASQEVPLGYFVDSTNGNDEETGLTIANTDIKVWKTGATTLANKNSGGATHISNGIYYAVLDATDTNTLGSLVLYVHVSGALAVRVECVVLAANVYDSLIGGGDLLDVNTAQANGTAWTSGAITRSAFAADTGLQSIRSGTAQAGAAGSVTLDASASATTDFYENCLIYLTGGTGVGQTRLCSAYNGTTKVATITPNWDVNPDNTSTFAVMPQGQVDVEMITGATVSTTTAQIGCNMVQISADATAADRLEAAFDDTAGSVPWTGISDQGTAQSVTASTIVLRAAAAFADDALNGQMVYIQSATTGAGQVRRITDFVGATDTATIEPNWDVTPTGTILYKIFTSVNDAASTTRAALGLASANLDTQLSTIDSEVGAIDTVVDAVKVVTDKLDTALVLDGAVYQYTANALELGPSGSGPSAADIADAVWDEALAGHAGAGSAGLALSSAGSAGDPWSTALPGAYGSGTAGFIVGTNLNATVSSRLASASYTAPDNATITAINAKTTNLPSDPADQSLLIAAISAVETKVDSVDTVLDALVADVGANGAGLTALPWNAAWDAEVQSEVSDALIAYDPPTKAELDAAVAPLALEASLANVPTNSELATALSPLALEASVTVIDGNVDAIKAKTDSLTFTVSGQVDANAESMNGTAILGNGTSGDLWRGS